MKIGIVSDIHAYFDPLERAVALFESQDVSHILCAGDLIDGGWDDESVIDFVRTRNIVSVRGNHDRGAFANDIEDLNVGYEEDVFGDLLNSYRAQYLSSLPTTRQFNWDGKNILLAHGAPWSDTQHVFPNSSVETFTRIFKESNTDIVILGHTHIPMKININDKWILNPGALCGNREDLRRTCGILELPQVIFEIFDVATGQAVELETRVIDEKIF